MNAPSEIAKTYLSIGTAKVRMPAGKLLLLGVFAGAFIAFGAVTSQAASVTIESASVAKLVSACVFPVGLSMVVLAGAELFTGNCLLVIPALQKKCSVASVLRNWVLVYIGNFIGAVLVAAACAFGHVYSLYGNALAGSVVSTAVAKVSLAPGDAILRGLLCNVLVCLAVWISFSATEPAGKILGLFLPVMAFVLCGFEHSVANMYYIPAGFFAGRLYGLDSSAITLGSFLLRNLLPVTVGNILGGAAVGTGYWAVYLRGERD